MESGPSSAAGWRPHVRLSRGYPRVDSGILTRHANIREYNHRFPYNPRYLAWINSLCSVCADRRKVEPSALLSMAVSKFWKHSFWVSAFWFHHFYSIFQVGTVDDDRRHSNSFFFNGPSRFKSVRSMLRLGSPFSNHVTPQTL